MNRTMIISRTHHSIARMHYTLLLNQKINNMILFFRDDEHHEEDEFNFEPDVVPEPPKPARQR